MASVCQCAVGAYNKSISPLSCALCAPGTYNPISGSQCIPCPQGQYSAFSGASNCSVWSVCSLGYYEATSPTATSDRVCLQINACLDFPCSAFSAGCADLPPPAGNTPSGRVCGACMSGYTNVGDWCVNSMLVVPPCSCAPQLGWVLTACGQMDTRLCSLGNGAEVRMCDNNGNWLTPDANGCSDGKCDLKYIS